MYRRRIQVDVDILKKVGYRTHAEFEDHNHHIKLDMVFQIGTGKVLEAKAEMIRYPFPECPLALEALQNIIGFRAVNFGSRKEVFKLVAGPKGCTHLAELVMESVNARIQATDCLVPDWVDPELIAQRRKQWENAWAGSCLHYTEPYWRPHELD